MEFLNLSEIKGLDIYCFGLLYQTDQKKIYIGIDVWLYIISYLSIKDIIMLSTVCKSFYGLCRSNYIWRNRLSEQMLEIIYNNNKSYFVNYFHFQNYVGINLTKLFSEGLNYLDLFGNMCLLVSDLRAPYYHKEILADIRLIYDNLVKTGLCYDELIYTVMAVKKFPKHSNCIWKYETTTKNSQLQLVFRRGKCDQIKLQKFVKPFRVPVAAFRKMKIIMYAETIHRLFK